MLLSRNIVITKISQLLGFQLGFFMVITIVPVLEFLQIRRSKFRFHDGCDFKKKVKLFN